jgi:hypothetical protein
MEIHWKTVLVKLIVWLAAEVILNLLGLDSLADYSEFLHDQEAISLSHLYKPAIVMPAKMSISLSL